jgi:hypothetical protein
MKKMMQQGSQNLEKTTTTIQVNPSTTPNIKVAPNKQVRKKNASTKNKP